MKNFSRFLLEKKDKTPSKKGISDSEINKRLSASTTKGDQARSLYGTDGGYGDSNVGDETANKSLKKGKPYTKAESDAIQTRSLNKKTKKFVNKPGTTKSKGPGASTGGQKNLVVNPKSKGTTPVTVTTKTSKSVEPLTKRMSKAVERGIKSGDIPQDALVRKSNKPKPNAGGAGETFKAKNTDKTLSTKQIDTSKVNARSAEILKINNKKPIKGGKTVNPVTAYDYKNVVKPDKFKDVVKKFQGSYKDINKIKKIPASEVKPVVPKKDPSFKISGTTSKTTPPSKPTFTKTDNPTFKDFKKRGISFDIKKSDTTYVKPVNLKNKVSLPFQAGKTSKGNVVTQSTSSAVPSGVKEPKLFPVNKPKTNPIKKVITKGMETTGLIDKKVDTKPFSRTTDTITRNVGKVKPSKLGRFVRGAGRIIAPIYAIKDYVDTTKKARAQGFSKNYSRAKGLTRALSGYIGGGIGATLGGGVASVPGAVAGGVTGYSVGQKIGDKAFDYGQKVVSGKKTFKDIRKDINTNVGKMFKASADR